MSWNPKDPEREFRERLLDPRAWEQTADQLLDAADLLSPKLDEFWKAQATDPLRARTSWRPWNDESVAIFFMLSAFAIENLMKACIVKANSGELADKVRSKARLPKVLQSHNLYELCVAAGLCHLAKEEEMLLQRLARSSKWYGRYPVPLHPDGLIGYTESKHQDFRLSLTAYTSRDRSDIQRIVTELKARLGKVSA